MRRNFVIFVLVFGLYLVFGLHSAMTQAALSGEALVNERCVLCHDLGRVNRAKATKDRAGWERTVDRMISKRDGLLNEEERAAVLKYLISTQPR